jgi:hypothetical protein
VIGDRLAALSLARHSICLGYNALIHRSVGHIGKCQSCQNILAWCWAKGDERYLIVINFHQEAAQARVHVPWDKLIGKEWRLNDVLSGDSYDRSVDEIRDAGLYVDLKPWGYHFFQVKEL